MALLDTPLTYPLAANPLDTVEQVILANDWAFDRRADDELSVQVPGQWCDYSLFFAWCEEVSALHFTCAFDMRIPNGRRREVHDLLALLNEKLWLGHFGIWDDEGLPMFRHALLLRGAPGASLGQLEDLVDIAVSECERFYPVFQYVVWAGKTPDEALQSAMIETLGEA